MHSCEWAFGVSSLPTLIIFVVALNGNPTTGLRNVCCYCLCLPHCTREVICYYLWNELCPNKIRGGLQAPKQQYLPSQPLTGHPLKPSQFGSRRLLLASIQVHHVQYMGRDPIQNTISCIQILSRQISYFIVFYSCLVLSWLVVHWPVK